MYSMDATYARMRDHYGDPKDSTREKTQTIRKNIKALLPAKWSGFKSLDENYKSAAIPPTCDETCESCTDQYLPKEEFTMEPFNNPIKLLGDKEAESEIKDLLFTINSNVHYIRSMIDSYGNAILKRWDGRSQAKRKAILLAADPSLYRQKHADVAIFFKIEDKVKDTVRSMAGAPEGFTIADQHDVALTSHLLDLPSLCEDLRLLSLIHYRTHYTPAEWIRFDCLRLKKFFHMGCLRTAYNPYCVVAYGDAFGKLVQWQAAASHKFDMIGYPAARLALEAQSKVTTLCRKVVDLLLENEFQSASKGREKWDALAATGFKKADANGTVSAYFEHAYAPPPRFDAARIASLIQTRLNASQDDLEMFQTDPIYAQQLIKRMSDYTQRLPISVQDRKDFLIQTTLRSLAVGSTWRWALAHAQRLEKLSQQFDDQPSPGKCLPAEYEDVLKSLESGMEVAYTAELRILATLVAPMPAFRQHFSLENYPQLKLLTPQKTLWRADPLLWNLLSLLELDEEYMAPPSFHFAFIDELVGASSSKDAERVDQLLYDHLSDLAAINEVLASIRYHRSRVPLGKNSLDLENVVDWLKADCDGVAPTLMIRNEKGDDRVWAKLEAFRTTPTPSPRVTEESILRLKNLHQTLDNYWCEVRKVNEEQLRELTVAEDVILAYVNDVSIGQRDDFKAAVEVEHEEMLRTVREKEANKNSQTGRLATLPDLSQHVYTFGSTQVKETDIVTTRKEKVKTRPQGDSSIVADHATDELESLTLTNEAEKTALTEKHSLAIFNRMFARSASKQGLTKWTEFIAALKDAGFSATHSGGSVVTFIDERAGKGAIAFHRPHPSPKIEPNKLRRWGWRLRKWFGWDEDAFILRSK